MEREILLKRVRGRKFILVVLMLTLATFAVLNVPVRSHTDPTPYVKVWLRDPVDGDNIFDVKPYPTPTFVEVWIDTPLEWRDTPSGIVGWTVSLQVDPTIVEPLSALQWPDTDFDGTSNGFLGWFLSEYGYNWMGYSVAFLVGGIDKSAGIIREAAEAILGFETLGKGAGGGPYPLMKFVIRTNASVTDITTAYSPLTIFDAYFTTVDGVKHPVDIVEGGHYGSPPIPEFPLGLGIIMMLTPAIPIIYLWRRRRWEGTK